MIVESLPQEVVHRFICWFWPKRACLFAEIAARYNRRMGRISRQLLAHFQRAGQEPILPQAQSKKKGNSAANPQDVKEIEELVESGMHPLHAAYVWAQNFVSLFTEGVATLDELDPYYRIVTQPEDEYVPDSPPISPVTMSYFQHLGLL